MVKYFDSRGIVAFFTRRTGSLKCENAPFQPILVLFFIHYSLDGGCVQPLIFVEIGEHRHESLTQKQSACIRCLSCISHLSTHVLNVRICPHDCAKFQEVSIFLFPMSRCFEKLSPRLYKLYPPLKTNIFPTQGTL